MTPILVLKFYGHLRDLCDFLFHCHFISKFRTDLTFLSMFNISTKFQRVIKERSAKRVLNSLFDYC
jgi:hypothetical protein